MHAVHLVLSLYEECDLLWKILRSNTHYVYHVITPSAICPHNHRLHPLERYKRQCGDRTVGEWDLRS